MFRPSAKAQKSMQKDRERDHQREETTEKTARNVPNHGILPEKLRILSLLVAKLISTTIA